MSNSQISPADICKKYDIPEGHVITDPIDGKKVIRKPGIAIIAAKLGINIKMNLVHYSPKHVVIWGSAKMINEAGQPLTSETFGEANPDNNNYPYPVAVAEARLESRLVLALAGLYDEYMGESEISTGVYKGRSLSGNSNDAIMETIKGIKNVNG